LSLPEITGIELDVERILDGHQKNAEIERVLNRTQELLEKGRDAVVYTSRQLMTARDEENLSIGKQVSAAMTWIVKRISTPPKYVIAKGGITASDVATQGLKVKRAMVLGQILPGVPVWRLGPESRFPGTPYVVFPGNVGDANALVDAVKKMIGKESME
jgi:uncharacterized protein YgbK (DUF1537 family)